MVGAATTYIIILIQVKWFLAVSNNIWTHISFSAYVNLLRPLNTVGVIQKQRSIPQSDIVVVPNDVQFYDFEFCS
jgi:hypothetical protein